MAVVVVFGDPPGGSVAAPIDWLVVRCLAPTGGDLDLAGAMKRVDDWASAIARLEANGRS